MKELDRRDSALLEQYEKSVAIQQNIHQWAAANDALVELGGRLKTLIEGRFFGGLTCHEVLAKGGKTLTELPEAEWAVVQDILEKITIANLAREYTTNLIIDQKELGVEDFDQALGMADAAQELMHRSCLELLEVIHRYQ